MIQSSRVNSVWLVECVQYLDRDNTEMYTSTLIVIVDCSPSQEMREVLFAASFCGLAWNDTHTANKCTNVAGLIYVKVLL